MNFAIKLLQILIIILLLTQTKAARILAIFSVPSITHHLAFRPFTQELVKRGHHVTVITPEPAFSKGKAPVNLTEIDVHDISYEAMKTFFEKYHNKKFVDQIRVVFDFFDEVATRQFTVAEVKEAISKKYDLLIVEESVKIPLAVSHILKVPTIQMSSMGSWGMNYNNMGAPEHPIVYPSIVQRKLYNLTMYEKINEIYYYLQLKYYDSENDKAVDRAIKEIFGNVPSIAELRKNVEMLFLNEHAIWADNRPVPPSVLYIGGLHVQPWKELPQDLKTYLDSTKNVVIYFNLGPGAFTSMLHEEIPQIIVNVFSQLPYDVLLTWHSNDLPGRTQNIKIRESFPQNDLLRHPKIKLFITQGGLQSTDEAISAGVPMIGIPMLGEQWYNTEKYVKLGIGEKLDIESLTEETFKDTIKKVIEDDSYRKNIIKLRKLIYDQPQSPLERAVWWTEHILRHGGAKHLRSPAANMSMSEYLQLNLVGFLITSILITVACVVLILSYLYRAYSRLFVSDKVKKS